MSATFLHPAPRAQDTPHWVPPTLDLEGTTDLNDEHTSDLAPETLDIDPASMSGKPDELHPDDSDVSADLPPPEQSVERGPARPTAPARTASMHSKLAAPRRGTLAPGAVLLDRYLIEQVIGSGGTAVVYRARDMASSTGIARNACIAIKAARPEADEARAAKRLRHEFEHAHRLEHPNIVRVRELHDAAQPTFMTMELLEGRLLSGIVRDWTMLPPPLTQKILHGCAEALAHAHSRHVVHGDFKPGNVFVTPDEQIKVMDFGAAAAPSHNGEPARGDSRIPAATPAYASPQVLSGQTPEPRDDVFSYACVAYELLTGQHPFERMSSLEARERGKIPARAWSLSATQWLALLSALSWDREQRPASVESLFAELTSESAPVPETTPIHAPAGSVQSDLPQDLMPPQRGWGFFLFIACALAVTFITAQQRATPDSEESPAAGLQPAALIAAPAQAASDPAGAAATQNTQSASDSQAATPKEPGAVEEEPSPPRAARATTAVGAPVVQRTTSMGAGLSEISFEEKSITTSEGSVAAVFLIKRSQPLRGRTRVQWNAISGTADAGIDFASDAAGSVEFADGQAQRAIYVPLRNDLIPEPEETFTVRLHSPSHARLGATSRAEATIRDDD